MNHKTLKTRPNVIQKGALSIVNSPLSIALVSLSIVTCQLSIAL